MIEKSDKHYSHSRGIPIPIPHSRGNWGMGTKISLRVIIPQIPHSRGMGMDFSSDFPILRHSPTKFISCRNVLFIKVSY